MPVSSLMDASRLALTAYQSAINNTARNISNADNPDYVRRRTDLAALLSPLNGSAFSEQENVSRLESGFIQNQLWFKNQYLGRYETDQLVYSQVEALFNEPSNSGISSVVNEFWNSWNDLANDPESNTARAIVKDKGVMVANTFNQLSTDLANMQREVAYDIEDSIIQINHLLTQIKSINDKVGGGYSYDLADARDSAITKLSKLMNIDVSENTEHVVSVTTGGGVLVPLVNGDFINTLEVSIEPFAEYYTVDVAFSEGGTIGAVTGGTLGALLDVHNDSIPGYIEKLDQLAVNLSASVNTIHKTGYNLTNDTGLDFFASNVSGASSMAVDQDIIDDPLLIATSGSPDQAGNSTIALAITRLQDGYIIQDQKFSDYYNSLISDVGSKVQEATFLKSSQEMVVTALQNQRDSISGVSLDEEMTNLVKYEQAYQAASRMISVADELVQAVLALI